MAESVNIEGAYGGPLLRDGLIVAFFRQASPDAWATDVGRVFELWSRTVPPAALSFALVGANASEDRPVNPAVLGRCRAQLEPRKASQREISSFELFGPQSVNPDYLFDWWGGRDASRVDGNQRTNYVEMRFPTEWAGADGQHLARFAREVAGALEFDSGYASLALHWSTDSELADARKHISGLVFQHPGYDVHDHSEARFRLGRRCVGARWLTFLGPELADELGGEMALRERLSPDIGVEGFAHGVSLGVPGPPRRGDVNRGDNLPELHRMAKVLEPVTFFQATSRAFSRSEDEPFIRWQRRFLDE